MAALPYMPLFVADYLADTAHLTALQHGAYMMLIMNYWQRGGPLPDDDARLARIARVGPREWSRMRSVISEFFSIADGTWSHSRITTELARVEAKSLKSKKAAQASVQRRFGDRSTRVEPTEAHTDTVVQLGKPNCPAGDSDKQFWDTAKSYLGPKKASLIGQWVRDHVGDPAQLSGRPVAPFRKVKHGGLSVPWQAALPRMFSSAEAQARPLPQRHGDR
jgi:uncharacterized protein YdaU (DUF1376 family)